MRKYFIILATVLIFIFPSFAFAETFSEAKNFANLDISARYGYPGDYFLNANKKGQYLNQNTWKNAIDIGGISLRAFVYGNPWGPQKQGVYRYLGYTYDGLGFTNINYPIDSGDLLTKYIEDLDWIEYPWNDRLVHQALSNAGEAKISNSKYFNCLLINRDLIYKGFQLERNANGRVLAGPGAGNVHWEKYLHVYQPATQYLCGFGRMWNKKIINGKPYAYYKTAILVPCNLVTPPSTPPKGEVPGFKGELGGGGGLR